LRVIRRTRALTLALGFMVLTSLGEGVMGTLFVPFVVDVLASDELGYGWIVSAQAVGGLIGSLLISWRGVPWPPARMVGVGAIGLSIIDLLTFNYHVLIPGIVPALVFMGLVGLPVAVMLVGYSTVIQHATTDQYRGRVLGAINAVAALAMLVGTGLAGTLGHPIGIVTMLNIQGLGYFLAGLLVLVLLKGQPAKREASAPNREIAGSQTA
jgi:MFS family permease